MQHQRQRCSITFSSFQQCKCHEEDIEMYAPALFTRHDSTTEIGSLAPSGVPFLGDKTCKTIHFNTWKTHSLLQTGRECIISLALSLTST